jgi:hypothetical protein
MKAMNTKAAIEPIKLGRTLITSRAKHALYPHEVLSALWNHAREEWGNSFHPADAETASPVKEDRRLVSNHLGLRGFSFWIATETLQPVTTVFLAGESDLSGAGLVEAWLCNLGCSNCGS